jgi:hypothetical protein
VHRACLPLGFALVAACSNPIAAGDRVQAGRWGGQHVALDVADAGGRIEYDCAHGTLDEPLELDRRGRFDVAGTHVRERGGPQREGEVLPSHPARYSGRVEGRTMTLTVTLTDTGDTLGPFTLTFGATPRLTKCL